MKLFYILVGFDIFVLKLVKIFMIRVMLKLYIAHIIYSAKPHKDLYTHTRRVSCMLDTFLARTHFSMFSARSYGSMASPALLPRFILPRAEKSSVTVRHSAATVSV
jgi:uncharacterized paraquat-inducible protein A